MNSVWIKISALLLLSSPLHAAQVEYYRLACEFPAGEQQWIVAYDNETSDLMFTGSGGAPSYSGKAANPEYLSVSQTTPQGALESLVLDRFTLVIQRLTTLDTGEVTETESGQCKLNQRQI